MKKEFKDLIGYEGSIIDLSNKLQSLDCEDICDFGNWSEIIESGDVVVATDEHGEKHIQIFFDVLFSHGEDEAIESSIIKITNVEEF